MPQMPQSLIREAARRGRAEAERRELQYQIDDAYHAEVEKVEAKRQREQQRQEARRQAAARASVAGQNLMRTVLTFGWLTACVAVGLDRTWEDIPALDDLFWDKEWLAYVALVAIYALGRQLMRDMGGGGKR